MKELKERIINLDNRDYHMHTSSFSDGIPTINELVQFAWTNNILVVIQIFENIMI